MDFVDCLPSQWVVDGRVLAEPSANWIDLGFNPLIPIAVWSGLGQGIFQPFSLSHKFWIPDKCL